MKYFIVGQASVEAEVLHVQGNVCVRAVQGGVRWHFATRCAPDFVTLTYWRLRNGVSVCFCLFVCLFVWLVMRKRVPVRIDGTGRGKKNYARLVIFPHI